MEEIQRKRLVMYDVYTYNIAIKRKIYKEVIHMLNKEEFTILKFIFEEAMKYENGHIVFYLRDLCREMYNEDRIEDLMKSISRLFCIEIILILEEKVIDGGRFLYEFSITEELDKSDFKVQGVVNQLVLKNMEFMF